MPNVQNSDSATDSAAWYMERVESGAEYGPGTEQPSDWDIINAALWGWDDDSRSPDEMFHAAREALRRLRVVHDA